jgi:hypothetical protein
MINSICWQHRWQLLHFAVWSNNNLVKTLLNFYGPVVLEAEMGVLQKKGHQGEAVEDKDGSAVPSTDAELLHDIPFD